MGCPPLLSWCKPFTGASDNSVFAEKQFLHDSTSQICIVSKHVQFETFFSGTAFASYYTLWKDTLFRHAYDSAYDSDSIASEN